MVVGATRYPGTDYWMGAVPGDWGTGYTGVLDGVYRLKSLLHILDSHFLSTGSPLPSNQCKRVSGPLPLYLLLYSPLSSVTASAGASEGA